MHIRTSFVTGAKTNTLRGLNARVSRGRRISINRLAWGGALEPAGTHDVIFFAGIGALHEVRASGLSVADRRGSFPEAWPRAVDRPVIGVHDPINHALRQHAIIACSLLDAVQAWAARRTWRIKWGSGAIFGRGEKAQIIGAKRSSWCGPGRGDRPASLKSNSVGTWRPGPSSISRAESRPLIAVGVHSAKRSST